MRLLFLTFLMITATWAEVQASGVQQVTAAQQGSESAQARAIEESYREFIDTRPSSQKKKLALKTKEMIISFQATFHDSRLAPSLNGLLQVINDYLNP